MAITVQIGQRIRFYRKKRGLSQEKLAEICNFHPTYVGQLERGEKNATIESIYRITQGLEISLSRFLENIESTEDGEANIPLEIYKQCLLLPPEKMEAVKKLFDAAVELISEK